jgi:hypothetical protein
MLHRLLLAPDAVMDAPPAAAPAAPAKPAAAAPPASTLPPSSAPAAAPEPPPSDDPFEPPKKPATAAPAKPAGDKPADVKPAPVDFDTLAPKELRARVKQLNQENQTFNGTIKTLEAKIKELDGKGVDTTALTTRLQALEKERDGALAELRAARQEASPEFKEKYDKPFNQAADRAKNQITELSVVTNSDTGETRPATWADFVALYQLPVGKAIEQATSMFGASAQFVLGLREKLLDLDTARQNALQEEKAQFKERSAKEIAEQAVKRETVGKLWTETNQRLAQSDGYKVDTTDAELAEAAKHAESVFDEPVKITDDASMQKKIIRDAHVKQKVIRDAVRGIIINRQKSEIEALKKQIEELKGTAPGDVQRGGGDAPAPADEGDWGQGLVKHVKSSGG